MFLNEAEEGALVAIVVRKGDHSGTFETHVNGHTSHGILADPVILQEKRVNFNIPGITLKIQILGKDSKVYEFINIVFTMVKNEEGHIIYQFDAQSPGKSINRRSTVRVGVALDAQLVSTTDQKVHTIMVKDVSNSGVAVVAGGDILEMGNPIIVTFEDKDEGMKFSLSAVVVRKEETDRASVIYGCKLKSEYPALSHYINAKQRKALQKIRRN